jgi:hypothetical protein
MLRPKRARARPYRAARARRLGGTLAPLRRASDRPIAMACFRLVTFLPERPERSVPRFLSLIARWTLRLAAFP